LRAILMKVKAVYESRVLRPLEELDLVEGEEVEIEVKKSIVDRTFGLIQLDSEVIDDIIEDTKYGSMGTDDFEDLICRRKSLR